LLLDIKLSGFYSSALRPRRLGEAATADSSVLVDVVVFKRPTGLGRDPMSAFAKAGYRLSPLRAASTKG
jgi:hypothetical protein